jgi:glycine/D-amino acid oxidase-like deaminating enzyme
LSAQKHIVVVGAGIIGASIAWHLTEAGARVTILDAREAGGVATRNSFAWINASWGNPLEYFLLRIRAMAEWKRLAEAVPEVPLRWSGGLLWDLPPDKLEAYALEHGGWGYGIRRVDREEAKTVEPGLLDPPDFALHVAEEGTAEPALTAKVLIEDAVARGARFLPNNTVTEFVQEGGSVRGVVAGAGVVSADEVVLAAGAATPSLAARVGINVPMTTPAGLLVHSRPHPKILNGLVMAPRLHMRQTAKGRIVSSADFSGGDPGPDPAATADALFAETKAMLSGAGDLQLDFHTVGYRPMPADGFPIVGRAGVRGVYVAATHSGITLAPAIGRFVAAELMTGRRDPLLAPYGPDRFEVTDGARESGKL